ncbi:hypothetical protein UlMin_034054 [Ulmus minor]
MSRCFPFPPPSYANKGARRESLPDLIKSEKEPKTERKRRKESKKSLKEYKGKETNTFSYSTDEKVRKLKDEKNYQLKKGKLEPYEGHPPKTLEDDSERSDVTEEHEQPTSSVGLSYSSDGTQSSNKRKRHAPTSNDSERTILRIRLPLQKIRASLGQEAKNSCNVVAETLPQDRIGFASNQPQPCQTQTETEKQAPITREVLQESSELVPQSRKSRKIQKAAAGCESLFGNWVPPPLQFEVNDCDEDWLFVRKPQNQHKPEISSRVEKLVSCSTASALWPQAQYIPEVEIYALPYAMPF